jgi:hypothetical protein
MRSLKGLPCEIGKYKERRVFPTLLAGILGFFSSLLGIIGFKFEGKFRGEMERDFKEVVAKIQSTSEKEK